MKKNRCFSAPYVAAGLFLAVLPVFCNSDSGYLFLGAGATLFSYVLYFYIIRQRKKRGKGDDKDENNS